jgi:hypothetical protein
MNLFGRFLLLLGALTVAITALAQPRDRRDDRDRDRDDDRRRGPRVIVYQDKDFRGDSLVIYPGDSLENLATLTFEQGSRLNDRISSIRIEGGAEIQVYPDSRFRGLVMRVTESVRDLTGRLLPGSVSASWNDRISSLRVESPRTESRRHDGPRVDADAILKRAFVDLLGREPDPAGLGQYRSLILDQGWTEAMVRDNIRRGDEFRNGGADRIINRAYREVLGREPDPQGLRHYRHLLLEKNWTENDVRAELRKSDEFRRSGRR